MQAAPGRKAFSAVAIVCVRNEEVHVDSSLRRLIDEGLDVILIDHDSTDRTVAHARSFLGRGLLSIEHLPWTGRFSIAEQLDAKARVIERVEHDWIVHADADEWLTGPDEGQTLLDGLRAADAAGYNAVHFNEYVFVPRRGEDVYGPDYCRRSTRYYLFKPHDPHLMRAWKNRSGLDNRQFAGHMVSGPVRRYPRDFPLRHYIVLSETHARDKYLGRRFDEREVARGFHFNRLLVTRENAILPADDEPAMRTLSHWASKDFDTTAPVKEHYWQWVGTARSALYEAAHER